jgi:hypothetical protein
MSLLPAQRSTCTAPLKRAWYDACAHTRPPHPHPPSHPGGADLPDSVVLSQDPAAGLANVASTVMNLMGFEAPGHMRPSLIEAA